MLEDDEVAADYGIEDREETGKLETDPSYKGN